MKNNFTNVQKRAVQYWFVDGLAELAAGLVSLFLAFLFWFWQAVIMWRWSLPVIMVAGLGVSYGLRLIIQRIKERTTYLRTGYTAPLSGLEQKWSAASVVAFTLLLLGLNYYLSTQGHQGLLWSPGVAGVVFAFIFTWTGALTQLRRFYFLAILSFCVGVVLAFFRIDYFRGVGVLAGVVGVILFYQGYRGRKAYISQNPPHNYPIHE